MSTARKRKAANAAAGVEDGTLEITAHGWRRVSRVPRPLRFAFRVAAWPCRAIYRQLHPKAA